MQIEIALEKLPRGQVLSLRGRLDSAGAPAFSSAMETLMKEGETSVLIDCSDLRYVSSMGLGAFVNYAKQLGAADGGGLAFAGLNQHVRSVFEMVGFFTIFEIYSSRQDALASPLFRNEA